MKKKWCAVLIMALVTAAGVFAEEYTFYYNGTVNESVTVQKDRSGKTTTTPQLSKDSSAREGNTTTRTRPDGSRIETIIEGNILTENSSNGSRQRQVFYGNTTTQINNNGFPRRLVVTENTLTISNSYDPGRGRN